MKTTVYLVRHAQSDHAIKDTKTRPLTEKGLKDAQRLVEILKSVPLSRIFSSPYLRACQTVAPISKDRNLPFVTDERMREWMGGRPFAPEFFESRMRGMFEDEKSTNGGAESMKALKKRTGEFIMHLLTRCPGETILVGTHALALTAAIRNYDDTVGVGFLFDLLPSAPFIAKMTFDGFRLTHLSCFDPFSDKKSASQEDGI